MGKPKFHVQHFVVCPRVTVLRAEQGNPYTLHDVRYTVNVPPDREFPVVAPELWLFVRFFFTGSGQQDFVIRSVWLDAPTREEETGFYTLPAVPYGGAEVVVSRAWKLGLVRLPGVGRYVFRLSVRPRSRVLAEEFLEVRKHP